MAEQEVRGSDKKRKRSHKKDKIYLNAGDAKDQGKSTPENATYSEKFSHCQRKIREEQELSDKEAILQNLPEPCLRQIRALDSAVQLLFEQEGLSKIELLNRLNICDNLQNFIHHHKGLEKSKLQLYGSSLTGFGLKGCDVNINISGDGPSNLLLIKVFEVLHMHGAPDYVHVKSDFYGKVPAVLLVDKGTGLTVELVVDKQSSVLTSKLLQVYSEVHPVTQLAVAFRYWAKLNHLDRQVDGTLPAYVFDLMVIHFLQQTSPPVLEVLPLPKIQNEGKGTAPMKMEDRVDFCFLKKTLKACRSQSQNTSSIGELWLRLLKFYSLHFDSDTTVVSVRSKEAVSREAKKWQNKMVAVEDPFFTKQNVAKTLSNSKIYKHYRCSLLKACEYFGLPRNREGKALISRESLFMVAQLNKQHHAESAESCVNSFTSGQCEKSSSECTLVVKEVEHHVKQCEESSSEPTEFVNEVEHSGSQHDKGSPNPALIICGVENTGSLCAKDNSDFTVDFKEVEHASSLCENSSPGPTTFTNELDHSLCDKDNSDPAVNISEHMVSQCDNSDPEVNISEYMVSQCDNSDLRVKICEHIVSQCDNLDPAVNICEHMVSQCDNSDPAVNICEYMVSQCDNSDPAVNFKEVGHVSDSTQKIYKVEHCDSPSDKGKSDHAVILSEVDQQNNQCEKGNSDSAMIISEFESTGDLGGKRSSDHLLSIKEGEHTGSVCEKHNADSTVVIKKGCEHNGSLCERSCSDSEVLIKEDGVEDTGTGSHCEEVMTDKGTLGVGCQCKKINLLPTLAIRNEEIEDTERQFEKDYLDSSMLIKMDCGAESTICPQERSFSDIAGVISSENENERGTQVNTSEEEEDQSDSCDQSDSAAMVAAMSCTPVDKAEKDGDGDAEDYVYMFSKEFLQVSKVPTVVCGSCRQKGHIKTSCPVNKKPSLKLPALTVDQLTLVNIVITKSVNYLKPTDQHMYEREEVFRNVKQCVQEIYPGACVELFGSSNNGFVFCRSDLDISMTLDGKLNVCEIIPTVAQKLMRYTTRKFRDVLPIATAKVPIIKFTDTTSGLEGDISLNNSLAVRNTRLVRCYSEIDERVQILGYAVKKFAKDCKIGDASRGSLSSYSYILMMLHYLQQCSPPVIPVLQELYEGEEKPTQMVAGWNTWFFDDLKKLAKVWPDYGKNTQSVGELWLGFLRYYVEQFDWKGTVVTIRRKTVLTKFEKHWNSTNIAVEDPFDLNHNLGFNMSKRMNDFIFTTFCTLCQRHWSPTKFKLHGLNNFELQYFFFDRDLLTGGKSPQVRGCPICGRVGHKVANCPKKIWNQGRGKKQTKDRRENYSENKCSQQQPGSGDAKLSAGLKKDIPTSPVTGVSTMPDVGSTVLSPRTGLQSQ